MPDQGLRADQPILFFDGLCGLCDRTVNFLLRVDHGHRLLFAPLQGPTAAARLPRNVTWPDTVVLLDQEGLHVRSEAALRTLRHLGGWWQLAILLRTVPRPMRDALYDWVAANRLRWFGRRDTCRVPTPAERGRLLP